MRKYLTMLLVLCTMLLISSCQDEKDPDTFYGVANGVSMNDEVSVTVNQKYAETYGKIVNVSMKGLDKLKLRKGDLVKITCESIESTYPLTVKASDVKIKNRNSHSENGYDYYGHGPYIIPDVSDLIIPEEFPDMSDKTAFEKNEFNWSYNVFRIVSIEKDKVYLADGNSNKARYVLYGSINESYKKGDFLKIDVLCHYESNVYDSAFLEDVSDILKVSFKDAEEIIKGMYSIE